MNGNGGYKLYNCLEADLRLKPIGLVQSLALLCVHQINRVNSVSGYVNVMMIASLTLSCILLLLLLLYTVLCSRGGQI